MCFRLPQCESIMPKIKTNSGAAKRFKARATGVKHKQSFTSHILTKKSAKRKRQLRGTKSLDRRDLVLVQRLIPQL